MIPAPPRAPRTANPHARAHHALRVVIAGVLAAGCAAPPTLPTAQAEDATAHRAESAVIAQRSDAIRRALVAGRLDPARSGALALVQAHPDSDEAHRLCVETLFASNDLVGAHDELRRWLRTHADSAESWHALAQCLLDPDLPVTFGGPAAAVAVAEQALELWGSDDARLLVTLGTARYLAGDVDGAVAAYERALARKTLGREQAALTELVRSLQK